MSRRRTFLQPGEPSGVTVPLVAVTERLNQRKNRLLLIAQAALSKSQYEAFRTLFLDELGRNGLEQDLVALWRGESS